MAAEVDGIGGEVVMWLLKLVIIKRCPDVAAKIDEIGRDVMMRPLRSMR